MSEIRTRPLMRLTIAVAKPVVLGPTPLGTRINVEVTGGSFEGERLRGEILSGGSDWLLLGADGVLRLDVRLCLRTADGALVNMTYRGFRHGPAEVIKRLDRGETVDPSEYYFRTAPFFETGAENYGWLNRIVAVASGARHKTGPVYEVFEVL